MPYNTQPLLLDANGKPIPQYYDPVADKFIPLEANGKEMQLTGSNGVSPAISTPADSQGNTDTLLYTQGRPMAYNGASWDRLRNNTEGTLLASAARTATTASAIQTNYNARGIMLYFHVTSAPGTTDSIQLTVRGKNPANNQHWNLYADSTVTTSDQFRRVILYPSASVNNTSITSAASIVLPRTFDVLVLHNGTGSFTYSVSYSLIL